MNGNCHNSKVTSTLLHFHLKTVLLLCFLHRNGLFYIVILITQTQVLQLYVCIGDQTHSKYIPKSFNNGSNICEFRNLNIHGGGIAF